MAVTAIKKDIFLHKALHLYYTPWVNDEGTWAPGTNTYDIVDIMADTISIEQGDPETETVDWEFGDTPLLSSSTKGERTVAASCIDMSFDIMEHVFGWARNGEIMVSEGASTESYATIVIMFHSTSAPAIVLPKVSMSSKTTIGTLKTSTGQADLSGTAMSAYISYNGATATTEMAMIKPTAQQAISIANSSTDSPVSIGTVNTDATTQEFILASA